LEHELPKESLASLCNLYIFCHRFIAMGQSTFQKLAALKVY